MLQQLVRWLRAKQRKPNTRHGWARWFGRSWARVTYARHIEPTWLELNQHDIPVHELPANFDGLRIVHLSDLHGSKQVTPHYLNEAVALAQQQTGDLIVLTGDFIHHGFKHVAQVAEVLGQLRAPLGVWAVLGNHDYSVRNALGYRRHRHLHHAVSAALQEQDIRVLHNEAVVLRRGSEQLHLAGVADLWSRECDVAQALDELPGDQPRVVLAHNPRTIEHLQGRRCDLMLSGHTHGGQVNLPRLGRVTLGRRARHYAAGLYHFERTHLYVHKGVGFGWRVRYGVRPEVAVLTLRTAPAPLLGPPLPS